MPLTKKFSRQAIIIVALVMLIFVSWPRQSTEKLLQRHLGLTNSSAFHNIRTDFQAAREWTAWIYLEGSASEIQSLLAQEHFVSTGSQPGKTLVWVAFSKAPPPPTESQAQFFQRLRPGIIDHAVIGAGSTQLWLVAMRY